MRLPGSLAISPNGGSVHAGSASTGSAAHFFTAWNDQLALDGWVSSDDSGRAGTDIPGAGVPLDGVLDVAAAPGGAVDALRGGAGKDRLTGGAGKDRLLGAERPAAPDEQTR